MPIVNYSAALNDLASEISSIAEGKGFWDIEGLSDIGIITTKLALVHAEVSEALEVHRKEYEDDNEDIHTQMTPLQEDDFVEELADIVIRVLDICGYHDFDIGNVIVDKMEKNASRPYRHGKRY